ncbi:MAG: carboxypeptidase-like regulatory domain-containing protein [Acidobacteriota bacterium]
MSRLEAHTRSIPGMLSWTLMLVGLSLLAVTAAAGGKDGSGAGEVTLPVADYHRLQAQAEAARARAQALSDAAEAPIHALVSYRLFVRIEDGGAILEARYEVERRGTPAKPVPLAVAGLPTGATVEPADAGASLHRDGGSMVLVAPKSGRYTVIVTSRARLASPVGAIQLPATGAPVASAVVDLPAELDWRCEGAVPVVASDESRGAPWTADDGPAPGRQRVHLALSRASRHLLEVSSRVDTRDADRLLAHTEVVTIVELGRDSMARRDIVTYDVSRGELASFEVDLPNGFDLDQVATDEGPSSAWPEGDRLTVPRTQRLDDAGHVMLESRPLPLGDVLPLAPITPGPPPRARYLVLAPSIAADVTPEPAAAWRRVDLDDLPSYVGGDVAAVGPSAAWRLLDTGGAAPSLRIRALPAADVSQAQLADRRTTTLMTQEGTLVHRDVLEIDRPSGHLDWSLTPGLELWSVTVDGQAVRPVERGGVLAIPLAFGGRSRATVEMVTRGFSPLGSKRQALELSLPSPRAAVRVHRWRLLLPESHRYRFAEGTLWPAESRREIRSTSGGAFTAVKLPPGSQGVAGQVVDPDGSPLPGVTVTLVGGSPQRWTVTTDANGHYRLLDVPKGRYTLRAELAGFDTVKATASIPGTGVAERNLRMPFGEIQEAIMVTSAFEMEDRRIPAEADAADPEQTLRSLRTGLASGVKPLRIEVPEEGKLLTLVGALPPGEVTVSLEVRPERR